ncbi:hypothetical protein BO78DRAFT_457084, partial [Aspergillus sclerotiicarbonarius CBS 121057]
MNPPRIHKATQRQIASTTRLSCEGCTKRKVKCDRLIPCTNCRNTGVLCVPVERRRLPRGRSRRNLPSQVLGHDRLVTTGSSDACKAWDQKQPAAFHSQTYIPSWVVPSQVVQKEPLDVRTDQLNGHRERQQLLHIYLTQVDPIVKILHRPSLLSHLLDGKCYLNYDPWHPAPTALASAIYYAASCTLSVETCLSLGFDKVSLIAKYQKDTNCALERADYLLTDDLTVLQAFVISLIAMRCHDRSRRFWTMLALALRIAQALSLHDPNPPFPVKPFEREMRRRLWHAIGWLDVQACLSTASEPMMPASWLRFQPFLDMNDDEFGADLEIQISPDRRISETSLFHILSYAQETTRYLTMPSRSTDAQRQILTFQKRTDELLAGLQPDEDHFHWYLKELSHSIGVFMQLLALRPPQKNPVFETCKATSASILRLAVEALDSRCRVYSSTKTKPWRWIQPLFFPWQALAVALAEIQVCDDLGLVESIWPLIEQSYLSFTTLESPSARLRQSMHDMMGRARASYDSMLLFSFTNESATLSWVPSMLQDANRHQTSEASITVDHQNATCHTALVDLSSLDPDFPFDNTAGFSESDILQALQDASDPGILSQ